LVTALDAKKLPLDNPKELYTALTKEYGWEKNDASKIWWMEDTCCLVDMTHGLPYLASVKDHIVSAVKSATAEGVLVGEPMRGVRFNILDAVLHSDSVHRSSAQIIPTAKRAFLAAQLCASPALVEPVFLAEIQAEQKVLSKIYSLLYKRRGNIIEKYPKNDQHSTFFVLTFLSSKVLVSMLHFDKKQVDMLRLNWSFLIGNAFLVIPTKKELWLAKN